MNAGYTTFSVYSGSANEVKKLLNKELENIHKWLLANKLTLKCLKNEIYDHWISSEIVKNSQ